MLESRDHPFCHTSTKVDYGGGQRMEVIINRELVRPRVVSVIPGVTVVARKLGVNGRSIQTLAAAIDGRVMRYNTGKTVLKALPCVRNPHVDLYRHVVRLIGVFGEKPTPMTRQEFVDCYKGRRHTIYQNAHDSLMGKKVELKDSFISAFVKCEKINVAKTPRVIQPRNPRYNVEVGKYLKHIEHKIYRCIAKLFKQPRVVAKGVNVRELGEVVERLWSGIQDPVFIGFDANRFDMHVTQTMLLWEHSIYTKLYPEAPDLAKLLRMQLRTKGFGYADDGKLKYRSVGHRASGDMNTGLGNCLIMCVLMLELKSLWGFPIKYINNGDDCGVICSRQYANEVLWSVPIFFKGFGFRVDCEEPVTELERIQFCGMHPISLGDGYVMVRHWSTALEKDSISITKLTSETMMRKWLYSVGECGLSLCAGIPVMQSFYQAYIRSGMKSNMSEAVYMECGARNLAIGLQPKFKAVEAVTRASFYVAFGVTPDMQIDLEQYFESWEIAYGNEGTPLSDVPPMGILTAFD